METNGVARSQTSRVGVEASEQVSDVASTGAITTWTTAIFATHLTHFIRAPPVCSGSHDLLKISFYEAKRDRLRSRFRSRERWYSTLLGFIESYNV